MGKRGRIPKSDEQKRIEGNPGKRRSSGSEPPFRSAGLGVNPPDWLDPVAKEKWYEVFPELQQAGLLTVVDMSSLAAYCQSWAEMVISTKQLQAEGRTVRTERGYTYPHPAVAMQRSAMAAIAKFSACYGLDPSSRSRFTGYSPDQEDELADFLNRRKKDGS